MELNSGLMCFEQQNLGQGLKAVMSLKEVKAAIFSVFNFWFSFGELQFHLSSVCFFQYLSSPTIQFPVEFLKSITIVVVMT